jgi:ribosome-binding protein aMBF1 (putative translation factor)
MREDTPEDRHYNEGTRKAESNCHHWHRIAWRIVIYDKRRIKYIERTRLMKTNRIMDDIRGSISPEMKLQMEMSVAIANRIYEILEAKGMTQKDLAKRLGKTETEVSRWLSGTHNLTLSTICKISAALEEEIVSVPHQVLEPELV